jgi:hypothetical protein
MTRLCRGISCHRASGMDFIRRWFCRDAEAELRFPGRAVRALGPRGEPFFSTSDLHISPLSTSHAPAGAVPCKIVPCIILSESDCSMGHVFGAEDERTGTARAGETPSLTIHAERGDLGFALDDRGASRDPGGNEPDSGLGAARFRLVRCMSTRVCRPPSRAGPTCVCT